MDSRAFDTNLIHHLQTAGTIVSAYTSATKTKLVRAVFDRDADLVRTLLQDRGFLPSSDAPIRWLTVVRGHALGLTLGEPPAKEAYAPEGLAAFATRLVRQRRRVAKATEHLLDALGERDATAFRRAATEAGLAAHSQLLCAWLCTVEGRALRANVADPAGRIDATGWIAEALEQLAKALGGDDLADRIEAFTAAYGARDAPQQWALHGRYEGAVHEFLAALACYGVCGRLLPAPPVPQDARKAAMAVTRQASALASDAAATRRLLQALAERDAQTVRTLLRDRKVSAHARAVSLLLCAWYPYGAVDPCENRHTLAAFGPYRTPDAAKATYRRALQALLASGGGTLCIPRDAPGPDAFSRRNDAQPAWDRPGVTVVDYRMGAEHVFVPPVGDRTHDAEGRFGGRIVERDLTRDLTVAGVYSTESVASRYLGGASSYSAYLMCEVGPIEAGGAPAPSRFYVPTVRGVFVGQTLSVAGKPDSYDDGQHVRVTALGSDAKGAYFEAITETIHPVGAYVSNKNVVNGLEIRDTSHCDNQSMSLQVVRTTYGAGDSFVVAGTQRYQGPVMSGGGDEGRIGFASNSEHDLHCFWGEVEGSRGATVRYKHASAHNPHKLGTSRPLINMNAAKWVHAGRVMVVQRGHDFLRKDVIERLETSLDGYGDQRTLVIGDKDNPWDSSLVGCFLAIAQEHEYYAAGQRVACHDCPPLDRPVYRWWHITGIERRPDERWNLFVERTLQRTQVRSGPMLMREANYTRGYRNAEVAGTATDVETLDRGTVPDVIRDLPGFAAAGPATKDVQSVSWTFKVGDTTYWVQKSPKGKLHIYSQDQLRWLPYIIAPGAWVSDVRDAVTGDTPGHGGSAEKNDSRTLRLAPPRWARSRALWLRRGKVSTPGVLDTLREGVLGSDVEEALREVLDARWQRAGTFELGAEKDGTWPVTFTVEGTARQLFRLKVRDGESGVACFVNRSFEPGDPITNPPGADVWTPSAFRAWHFDNYPGTAGTGHSFQAMNKGMVQIGSGLLLLDRHDPQALDLTVAAQKDARPSFGDGVRISAASGYGVRIDRPTKYAALHLEQGPKELLSLTADLDVIAEALDAGTLPAGLLRALTAHGLPERPRSTQVRRLAQPKVRSWLVTFEFITFAEDKGAHQNTFTRQYLVELPDGATELTVSAFAEQALQWQTGAGLSRFHADPVNGVLKAAGTTLAANANAAALKKETTVDGKEILKKVATLPIARWTYTADPYETPHLGPTAENFKEAFAVGGDATHICTVDADGVALAAIQGLSALVDAQAEEIAALKTEQRDMLAALTARLAQLEAATPPDPTSGGPGPTRSAAPQEGS